MTFIEDFISRAWRNPQLALLTEVAANGTNFVTFSTASSVGIGKLKPSEATMIRRVSGRWRKRGVGHAEQHPRAHPRPGTTNNYPYSATGSAGQACVPADALRVSGLHSKQPPPLPRPRSRSISGTGIMSVSVKPPKSKSPQPLQTQRDCPPGILLRTV